jgi:hypothetical protein
LRHGGHGEKVFIRPGKDDRIKRLPPSGNICAKRGHVIYLGIRIIGCLEEAEALLLWRYLPPK